MAEPKVLGRVLLIPRGEYDENQLYNNLDWVRYNGKSWVCKKDNTIQIEPDENENWTVLAQDGNGQGDMEKRIYDKNDDGVVDNAENALFLKNSDNKVVSADTIIENIQKLDEDGEITAKLSKLDDDGEVTQKLSNLDQNGEIDASKVKFGNSNVNAELEAINDIEWYDLKPYLDKTLMDFTLASAIFKVGLLKNGMKIFVIGGVLDARKGTSGVTSYKNAIILPSAMPERFRPKYSSVRFYAYDQSPETPVMITIENNGKISVKSYITTAQFTTVAYVSQIYY